MRSEAEVEHHYQNYCKLTARHRINSDKHQSQYFYGAAVALGLTLQKKMPEIDADIAKASKKIYNSFRKSQ